MLNRNELNERTLQDKSQDKAFPVITDKDVVMIREHSRNVAEVIGFNPNERTLIATVVSEICRNIIEYAEKGSVSIVQVCTHSRRGIRITAIDQGPGIPDIELAMQDGYSTRRGMGLGLPGSRRIMDEFKLESEPGKGTKIVMCKWMQ